jgi:hypothetical protein
MRMDASIPQPLGIERKNQTKAIVRGIYDHASHNDIFYVKNVLHPHFVFASPSYLPWGGITRTAENYLRNVIPHIARFLDFHRFQYLSLTAEDNCVVALFNVGVADSEASITACEHWFIEDGLARSMQCSLYEPLSLLVAIEHVRQRKELLG